MMPAELLCTSGLFVDVKFFPILWISSLLSKNVIHILFKCNEKAAKA